MMPFVKSNAEHEKLMLEQLVSENDVAKQAHAEFMARIELQKQLADARKAEGLTQAEVAKKSGLSQQAVSRVENGTGWTVSSLLKYLTGIGYEVRLKKV